MNNLYFTADHINGNTLVGYGVFRISTPGVSLPLFHFLSMSCESTSCIYAVNLETGVYFKAGDSALCYTEEKALQGFIAAMASFMEEVVNTPSGEDKLGAILEAGGQEIFWNQYNKLRFLYRGDKSIPAEGLIQSVKAHAEGLDNFKLEEFLYYKPKEE